MIHPPFSELLPPNQATQQPSNYSDRVLRRSLIAFALWTLVAILFTGQLALDAAYGGNRVTLRDALVLAFTGW